MKYEFTNIEKKWQKKWLEEKTYAASNHSDKPKFYALVEFPYPSGQVLSVRLNSGDAMQNVPRSLKNDGHRVFDVTDNEDGTYTILVERGQDD